LEADWVDLVTPLAFGFEAAGTYLLAEGPASGAAPVMTPPAGIPRVDEFFADLGKEITGRQAGIPGQAGRGFADVCESDIAAAPNLPKITIPEPPGRDGRPGMEVALTADPLQYWDGHMTGRSRWSRTLDLLPELRIPVQDADALGLSDGDVAIVSNEQGQARARIVVTGNRMETVVCYGPSAESVRAAGWGGISGGHPAVRRLAPWRAGLADEAALAGAIRVEIAPVPGKRIEEADHAHA
jgi:anaerobic selenocysteine-containing dehydrogenase